MTRGSGGAADLTWRGQRNWGAKTICPEHPHRLLDRPSPPLEVGDVVDSVVTVSGPVKTVYIGAQNAVDGSRNIVGKGDIGAQTEQILRNIDICLAAAGARREHLISWNIYVAEGQDLAPAFEAGMSAVPV